MSANELKLVSDCDILLNKRLEEISTRERFRLLFFFLATYVGETEDGECVGEV